MKWKQPQVKLSMLMPARALMRVCHSIVFSISCRMSRKKLPLLFFQQNQLVPKLGSWQMEICRKWVLVI